MVGLLTWRAPGEKRNAVGERVILRTRFLWTVVGRSPYPLIQHRRILAAEKRLRRQGVTRVVLPEGFPAGERLSWLRPVSTLALRRSLAADWVRAGLGEKGLGVARARVAVAAPALTGEVVRTVTELCLRHRYVLLDLPYGGEELCRQLRREYGVSLLLGPSRDQMEGAEALVLFDARSDLDGKNPVLLRLYDETVPLPELALPPELEVPEGVDRGQLLAALREAGALAREDISLVR